MSSSLRCIYKRYKHDILETFSSQLNLSILRLTLGKPSKRKYYLDTEIVPISSDPPTIATVIEHLVNIGKISYPPTYQCNSDASH